MTLRAMTSLGRRSAARAVGACLVCVGLLVACGRPDDGVIEARKAAEAAGDRVDELEATVAALASDLATAEEDLVATAADRDALAGRLERGAERLRDSLHDVRRAVGEVRASSSAASSSASSAIAEVGSIAHSLAVLENRYDYHLRHYHGGS